MAASVPLNSAIVSSSSWWRVKLPANSDASFGAALIAGVGIGLFESPAAAVARCVRLIDSAQPEPARQGLYDQLFAVYREAQACLAPLDHRLQALTAQGEA